MCRAPLPDFDALDRDALAALVLAQHEELTALAAAQNEQLRSLRAELDVQLEALARQSEELQSRGEQIKHLKLVIEKFRHMLFGAKSEKLVLQVEQMEFQLEELEADQAEAEMIGEAARPDALPKTRSARKPLPEHLPREVVTHLPVGDGCPDCGAPLRQFGEDVTEQLEYIPESVKVISHVRPKFACRGCDPGDRSSCGIATD